MDQQKRLLTALALAFALTAVYMIFKPPMPPEEGLADGGVAAAELTDGGTPVRPENAPLAQAQAQADGGVAAPNVAAAPAPAGSTGVSPTTAPAAEVKTVKRPTEAVNYALSTRGAGLVQAELLGPKMREQRPLSAKQGWKLLFGGHVPDAAQMDMGAPANDFPPALSVGVRGSAQLDPWAVWHLDEKASNDQQVVFTTQNGTWQATKTLRWPQAVTDPKLPATHGYEIAMILELRNVSQQPAQGDLAVHYARAASAHEEKGSMFGGVGSQSKAVCGVKDDMESMLPGGKTPDAEKLTGPLTFVGVDQQYFLGSIFPLDAERDGRCELFASDTSRAAVGLFPITVAPGQAITRHFGVYIGPKDTDYLNIQPTQAVAKAAGVQVPAFKVPLNKTVNFGIWEFICVVLLGILKFFHGLLGNWGLAIVFLTVTIKMALLPLTYKSMVSAENMKKLSPKMAELRKKYEGDRERLNMEMMKLYQQEKVNPVGGCFPMLIQMPVWIALYATLRNSFEIYREPFFGPVWTDLTYKDPTYLFPLLLGITMIATQRLQPSMMDAAQQKMMTWFMPILFTGMMLFYPAGLTLYIFTNNILSIVQQFAIRRIIQKRGGGGSAVPAKA